MLDLATSTLSYVFRGLPGSIPVLAALANPVGSAAMPARIEADPALRAETHGSMLPVKTSLTMPMHLAVDFNTEMHGTAMTTSREAASGDLSPWLFDNDRLDSWRSTNQQFIQALELVEGWAGPGSMGPTMATIETAAALLDALETATIGTLEAPMIGLDSDGCIVMTWDSDSLLGSLSVFDDRTFAYYIERNGIPVQGGEGRIDQPLDEQFLAALSV